MSDFDKEAEREKLREKYARDKEKRATTQRMSELLLQGATMTNTHCGRCSDPLFRYDGQTFCPSCQAEGTAAQSSQQTAQDSQQTPQHNQETSQDNQQTPQHTQETSQDSQQAETNDTKPHTQSTRANPEVAAPTDDSNQSTAPQYTRTPDTSSSTERGHPSNGRRAVDETLGSTDDLTAARASLRRTVTRFAQQAEGTDDPRRARELLGAAREAAATLAALD